MSARHPLHQGSLLCKHCGEPIASIREEDLCAERPPPWPPADTREARYRIRRWRYALERMAPRPAPPQRIASEVAYWLPREHPQWADAYVCAGKPDIPREVVATLLTRIEASLPPDTEAPMGARIDRKFTFAGLCTEHRAGHSVNHFNALVFVARDRLLVPTLTFYRTLCLQEGADERQVQGVDLLIARVIRYQEEHPEEVKLPDVEPGPAGDPIVAPNEAWPQLPGVPS